MKSTSRLLLKYVTIFNFSSIAGVFGVITFIVMAVISLGFGASRIIIMNAQTTGLQITFLGQSNNWLLTDVLVCTPRTKNDWALPRGNGKCDARRYSSEKVQDSLRINWRNNAKVQVTSPSVGELVFEVSDQADIADKTRIILGQTGWRKTGALTFSGTARIGDQLASGETKMILEGSFEVREKPLWSENTEVLKAGLIRRGESAAVFEDTKIGPSNAEVFGHITPVELGKTGFAVGVVSSPGSVNLQLGFFGASTPTKIAPSWIDRALTSPLVLALAALLSVVLSVGQFLGSASFSFRKPRSAKDKYTSHHVSGKYRSILMQRRLIHRWKR